MNKHTQKHSWWIELGVKSSMKTEFDWSFIIEVNQTESKENYA